MLTWKINEKSEIINSQSLKIICRLIFIRAQWVRYINKTGMFVFMIFIYHCIWNRILSRSWCFLCIVALWDGWLSMRSEMSAWQDPGAFTAALHSKIGDCQDPGLMYSSKYIIMKQIHIKNHEKNYMQGNDLYRQHPIVKTWSQNLNSYI